MSNWRKTRKSVTKKILRESLPTLFSLVLVALFAGFTLSALTPAFEMIPGLIIIIPALIDMRGNINGALGARLGSAVHLGLIDLKNIFNLEMKENLKASIALSAGLSLFAGFFAWLTCLLLKIKIEPLRVVLITFISGTIAGVALTLITVLIVILAVKKKLDPDNVTTPILATLGDAFTLLCLFGVIALLGMAW